VSPRRIVSMAMAATALMLAAPALADLPIVNYSLTGPPGDNGWFVGPVTVKWTLTGETSSSGCDTRTLTADTGDTKITCTASNIAGPVAGTATVRIDQTAPTDVVASAARPPDTRSWFTAPIGITWSGKDAVSGVAACTSLSYTGPDASAAAPAGTCRDRAGNVSAPVAFSLDYDATPPALDAVTATAGPGRADIRWAAGADAVRATVVREPVGAGAPPRTIADGPASTGVVADTDLAPATTYTWTVTALDAAGNAASQRVTATTPAATAVHGGSAAQATKPRAVRLRWRGARGAGYYNVQVFRGTRKVLSAWPRRAQLRLATHWRYRGRAQRLVPGTTYRWYAWAGYGPRAAHRYGHLLAHGRFTVPPARS
jgi:hypothetical protein